MKKHSRSRIPKLRIDEMAEVMELREKGVSWDNLAIIFDISRTTLKKYYRNAQLYGFDFWTDYRI